MTRQRRKAFEDYRAGGVERTEGLDGARGVERQSDTS